MLISHPISIVSVGAPAANFVQRHRKDLFPTTPMVFTAVERRRVDFQKLTEHDAVVASSNDDIVFFENILRVLPLTKTISVVVGTSPNETFWREELRRTTAPLAGRVQFRYYNELSFEDILRDAAALGGRGGKSGGEGGGVGRGGDEEEGRRGRGGRGQRGEEGEEGERRRGEGGERRRKEEKQGEEEEERGEGEGGEGEGEERREGVGKGEGEKGGGGKGRGERGAPHNAIFWLFMNVDGAGVTHESNSALLQLAAVANAPIFSHDGPFFGDGIVGGPMQSIPLLSKATADVALRILDGEKPADIKPSFVKPAPPIFDWRKRQRWGIAESSLPSGSTIAFREPSLWERYSWQIASIVTVLLIQAGLIVLLLTEHRRRQLAEVQSRQRMAELAHVNRFSTAGELTASIAHEIKLPLGSILANAETAQEILKSPSPDIAELNEIVDDILKDTAVLVRSSGGCAAF